MSSDLYAMHNSSSETTLLAHRAAFEEKYFLVRHFPRAGGHLSTSEGYLLLAGRYNMQRITSGNITTLTATRSTTRALPVRVKGGLVLPQGMSTRVFNGTERVMMGPRWFKLPFYIEKELVGSSYNHMTCVMRFFGRGSIFSESVNSVCNRVILHRTIDRVAVPRDMRRALDRAHMQHVEDDCRLNLSAETTFQRRGEVLSDA